MSQVIQSRTRQQIRQSIERNLGIAIIGEATSTVDTTSLIDTKWLARGGDDEHNGKQVVIYDATGSIVDGETSFVSDFAAATYDATCTPAFSASIADGDKYEMITTPWTKEDIDDIINQAIADVSDKALQVKETHATFTDEETYLYNCLSGYDSVHKVEYEAYIGTDLEVDDCDSARSAGSNTTVTADSTFKKEGSASAKVVVAGAASTNEVLVTGTITSKDLSNCDKLEFTLYSSVALTAGQWKIRLNAGTEAINIPATTANTWTRHIVSLANPTSDTAITSWDIYQVSDVGACTCWVDYIRAAKDDTRTWKTLNPQQWTIVKGSTPYLKLSPSGLAVTGNPTLLRVTGHAKPDLMTAETDTCDIDPSFVIAWSTWMMLTGHAYSPSLDVRDRKSLGDRWKAEVERKRSSITADILPDTRWVN